LREGGRRDADQSTQRKEKGEKKVQGVLESGHIYATGKWPRIKHESIAAGGKKGFLQATGRT